MIPRAVPRWPGPKQEWAAFGTFTSAGQAVLLGATPSDLDYVIETIDVYATTSGVGTEQFQIYMVLGAAGSQQNVTFFGGQVSSATGLYFPYRGPLVKIGGSEIHFDNLGGGWSVVMAGFFTGSKNLI